MEEAQVAKESYFEFRVNLALSQSRIPTFAILSVGFPLSNPKSSASRNSSGVGFGNVARSLWA